MDEPIAYYECGVCDWVYDENIGDPDGGIPPGTRWEDIPEAWVCPVCGEDKNAFTRIVRKARGGLSYLADWERESDNLETAMRSIFLKASKGHEEISPMRTRRWRNLFEEITFLPGQIARRPLDHRQCQPDLTAVIGPGADRPLSLALPFYVSDMSFGSLSKEAKIALAKGSAATGTAIFSGEGGMLPEERAAAAHYVFEYSTGRFGATPENIARADAIQIKFGQAAKAGLGGHLLAAKVTAEIAAARNKPPNQDIISPANHTDITNPDELRERVQWLRETAGGVPVGVKVAAGWIEADLEAALAAGVDFVTIDCRGGSTGAAPNHIKDNVCVPAPFAVARARRFLDAAQPERPVSLLITGGLRDSADIAKCLAMGADAVGLATVAMIGIGCQQYRVCHKGTCPVGIATQDPKLRARFDVDRSAAMLKSLFTAYGHELADFVRICGKERSFDLAPEDLAALTWEVAQGTGIAYAGIRRS